MSGALSVLARIEAAWFAPMPAARLALVRALVGTYAYVRVAVLFGFVLPRAARGEALVEPVGMMRLLPQAPSVVLLGALVLLAAVSGPAFVAGYRYRWAAPCFAGSLIAILSYFNSFGMIYHSDQLLVLHVLVLAVAPAADAFSLDARRRERAGEPAVLALHWRYGWPIRLLCALTVTVYALAGIAKLAAHGLSWAVGDALRAQIAKDALRKQLLGEDAGLLGAWVWRNPWVATVIGVTTLVMELGAPLFLLLGRRASRGWALFAFAMHWGVYAIMGITFRYQLTGVTFAPFFAAERLLDRWRRESSSASLARSRESRDLASHAETPANQQASD
jgi:hypothetical protein